MITVCVLLFMGMTLSAQEQKAVENVPQQVQVVDTEDYAIVKDEVVDGVRYVVATPSAKVCSKQIDIEIKDGIIQKVVYTRGREGNAKGIGALIKDMTVEEAISRLDGITCGKRGTSCPDQLAKVLKALK
jgi:uncharacterized protein (TIGR03905 family)